MDEQGESSTSQEAVQLRLIAAVEGLTRELAESNRLARAALERRGPDPTMGGRLYPGENMDSDESISDLIQAYVDASAEGSAARGLTHTPAGDIQEPDGDYDWDDVLASIDGCAGEPDSAGYPREGSVQQKPPPLRAPREKVDLMDFFGLAAGDDPDDGR